MAARLTAENLICSLSLFAEKPIRVGGACRHGTDEGTDPKKTEGREPEAANGGMKA